MAYCETSDVQSEFKKLDLHASNTLVTTSDVAGFITQEDALINSFVRQRYALPIVDTEALALLKLFSITLTAERVKSILRAKQGITDKANQETKGTLFSKDDVLSMLKKIATGDIVLGEAALALPSGTFISYNKNNNVEPVFKKDEKSW